MATITPLTAGKMTMFVGLNYGSSHPDDNLKGTAMAASRALDSIVPIMTGLGFTSFTVSESIGFWEGKPEKSLVILV